MPKFKAIINFLFAHKAEHFVTNSGTQLRPVYVRVADVRQLMKGSRG